MCNTNDTPTEIVAMPAPASNVDMTEDILAAANRRVQQLDKIVSLALGRTNSLDWVDQDGHPYLCASGAEKIARLFGVCWKDVKCEKIFSSDEKGQFYYFEYTAIFTLGNDSITSVGTCSQKDKFFAVAKGQIKPASEIDETNIRKAAYSNMIVNGVSRILGIRNLTWEQLQGAGIERDKTAKVQYAKGGNGGGRISEAQAKRFFAICKQAGKSDEEIKKHLQDVYKIDSTKEIKTSDYDAVCKWAEGGAQ